jgi:hypothetical protein
MAGPALAVRAEFDNADLLFDRYYYPSDVICLQ